MCSLCLIEDNEFVIPNCILMIFECWHLSWWQAVRFYHREWCILYLLNCGLGYVEKFWLSNIIKCLECTLVEFNQNLNFCPCFSDQLTTKKMWTQTTKSRAQQLKMWWLVVKQHWICGSILSLLILESLRRTALLLIIWYLLPIK